MRAWLAEKRRPLWALLVLVVVAAVLRLPTIGRESLWYDEAVSYMAAQQPLSAILNNTVQSSHPPLYYILLHFWQAGSDTEGWPRLLGTVFNLGLIPVLYVLVKMIFDDSLVALLAAAMVTISPFHILYSHELRMYTLLMLLIAGCVIAYVRLCKTGRWLWFGVFVVISALAVYTHLFAWLALAAMGLDALLGYRQNRRALWLTALAGIVLLVLFLPWVQGMLAESQHELGSMRPLSQASTQNPIKWLTAPAFLLFGSSDSLAYSALVFFLTLSWMVILAIEFWKTHKEAAGDAWRLPALIAVVGIGVPVAIYMVRPFFLPERTLALASPMLIALFAWGINRRSSPLPYLALAGLALMIFGSGRYLWGDLLKPPYRKVMDLVASSYQDGDAVLHTSDGSFLPALCYTDWPQHAVLDGDPDPRKPAAVYRQLGGEVWTREQAQEVGTRLWVIVALEHSVDWQVAQHAFFAQYPLVKRHEVQGIVIDLYDLTD